MIIKNNLTKAVLLLGTVVAKINGVCVPLTNTKSCPGFESYSMDTENGIFPLSSQPHYTDVSSLDIYISKYSEFLVKSFVGDLAKNSNCNKAEMESYGAANLRYLNTYACNFILNSSKNKCKGNQKKVCKSVCNDFFTSFQGLINNFNTCLNQTVVSENISSHNTRCTKSTSNFSADSNCVDSSNETSCGFKTLNEAKSYCATSSNDACCSSLGAAGANEVTGAAEANGIQNNISNAGSPTSDQGPVATSNSENLTSTTDPKESEPKGGNSKLWIIIIAFISLLVFGALIYFYKKGESLDKSNNSFYEENRLPYGQQMMENRGFNNSGGYSSPPSSNSFGMNNGMNGMGMGMGMGMNGMGMGMNNNIDTDDVLINRSEMNNMGKLNDTMDSFNFGNDTSNYNFTSNVQNNNNGFNNAALYAGAGAAALGGAALGAAALSNNNNNNQQEPQAQMVNMTNIQPPETQDSNNKISIVKDSDEPQLQMVNMTNIQPPESQDRNDSDQPPVPKEDEEPKPQMVNMTEIPEPEVQQNRNTKFLSTYSEAPSNQRISSQFYGESEASYDYSSSKLNIPLDNKTLSMGSSTMISNRMSTSTTDRELNSTPYRAVHTYEPQLNDELLLEINDIVEVVYIYDDGWVWGINTRTNESGACPMLCLEKIDESENDFSIDEKKKSIISNRESMISRDSVPGRRDSRVLKIDGINR